MPPNNNTDRGARAPYNPSESKGFYIKNLLTEALI